MSDTLVGLNGYAQSGKDTAAEILVNQHGYTRFAFADTLKEMALDIDPFIETARSCLCHYVEYSGGWDKAKQTPEVRKFLQDLGLAVRKVSPDFWVDAVARKIAEAKPEKAVISDVRFPNEIQWIRDQGGTTIRVWRGGVKRLGHESETALLSAVFDYELENNSSIVDLSDKLKLVIRGELWSTRPDDQGGRYSVPRTHSSPLQKVK